MVNGGVLESVYVYMKIQKFKNSYTPAMAQNSGGGGWHTPGPATPTLTPS